MDFDGDGRMDILTGSISGKVHWYRRKPNGAFAAGETLKRGWFKDLSVGAGSAVCAADWNGDGTLDLLIGNGEGGVFLVLNEGTARIPAWGAALPIQAGGRALTARQGAAGPCVADWDRDGRPDLLLGSTSGEVVWCRNLGTVTAPELAAPVTLVESASADAGRAPAATENPQRSGAYSKVCVADWNGDGLEDLIVGDYSYRRAGGQTMLHGWVWVYLRKPTGG